MLAVAAFAGILVLAVAWWIGPDLFGRPPAPEHRITQATVTQPVSCTEAGDGETVQFEFNGETRSGILNACGHSQDELLDVAVPVDAGEGLIDVRLAATAPGHSDLRRPVGLVLLALSCAGGGIYSYLVRRGPRRRAVLI
ncbi:hypothetical protein SAMN05216266_11562 [Amycolatopsis marina]|uniref:Uncharacterized protein n=1 Tax=Amycolatopsis marina TaxID=490629 RepID=A0A1I1BLJ2_9PSEU|nr:hypothetical protein SAMN05216266_11562 [Amycolatopsis marina]